MSLLVLLLLALCGLAAAEETLAPPEIPPPPASLEAPRAAPPPAAPPEDLYRQTLRKDVAGASYYELLAWCRELGLDDTGDQKALEARLLGHFGIRVGEPEAQREVRVEILSARETEYFSIEEVDEDYVLLRGGVAVKVRDRDRDSVHTVEAETLVYNQTTKRMTASGGARYVLTREGKDEVFQGESLSFDTETLEAVFYDGSVERERSIGGVTLPFTFKGRSISRLSNETVILDDGTITSSTAADPYYVVHARRAWILGGGEWAVLGATLRVGRVPVLYLPFFFYPGDEVLLHPSLEQRAREGWVLQTSTYLIGQRQSASDPLSLLQLAEEPGAQSARVRRGLFLTADSSEQKTPGSSAHSLVLMADLYSRLGAMVGLKAAFAPLYSGQINLGVSRTIVRDDAVGYTPYRWNDAAGEYESDWNHSSLVGIELPLRFGLDSNLRVQTGLLSASLVVELYSDPYFPSDFYDRSESMKWDELLGGAGAGTSSSASVKNSLNQKASASVNLATLIGSPLLSEIAIRSLDLSAFFASRANATLPDDEWSDADPARTFYYPASARAPSISLGLRGTLLSLPGRPAVAAPASGKAEEGPGVVENPGKGIRSPWEEEEAPREEGPEEEPDPAESPERSIVEPASRADAPVSLPGAVSNTFELTYSVTPLAAVDYAFASSAWEAPEDVSAANSLASVLLSAQSDAKLTASGSLLSRLVSVSNELQATGSVRKRVEGNAGVDLESYRIADLQSTKLVLSDKSLITLQPFLGVEALKSSSLAYTFGWQFLGIAYDAALDRHVTSAWTLDETTVSAHTLAATLAWKPPLGLETLSLTAVLPPETVSLRGQAQLGLWKLTLRASLGAQQSDTEWTTDPLALGATFQPLSWLSATWDMAVDMENYWPTRMSTNLKMQGLSLSLTQSRRTEDSVEQFLPALLQFQYALPTQKAILWRNRIKIEGGGRSGWTYNFARPTQSEFTFNMNLSLSVYKFLTFTFSSQSYNNRTYLYLPSSLTKLPYAWVNPVTDLLRSFNFLDIADRYRSAFKVRSLSITVTHQMVDWDFSVSYNGKPELRTLPDGSRQYEWDRTLSFLLQWKALPILRARATQSTSDGFVYGQ